MTSAQPQQVKRQKEAPHSAENAHEKQFVRAVVLLKVPDAHKLQRVLPADGCARPGWHSWHAALAACGPKRPAGQDVQEVDPRARADVLPLPHGQHSELPVPVLKRPAPQSVHTAPATVDALPAAQGVHWELPAKPLICVPSSQPPYT